MDNHENQYEKAEKIVIDSKINDLDKVSILRFLKKILG